MDLLKNTINILKIIKNVCSGMHETKNTNPKQSIYYVLRVLLFVYVVLKFSYVFETKIGIGHLHLPVIY